MRKQPTSRNFVLCLVTAALVFVTINLRRDFCDDCAMRVGRPFAYKITNGYAFPQRWLWAGIVADSLVVVSLAGLLYNRLSGNCFRQVRLKFPKPRFQGETLSHTLADAEGAILLYENLAW